MLSLLRASVLTGILLQQMEMAGLGNGLCFMTEERGLQFWGPPRAGRAGTSLWGHKTVY